MSVIFSGTKGILSRWGSRYNDELRCEAPPPGPVWFSRHPMRTVPDTMITPDAVFANGRPLRAGRPKSPDRAAAGAYTPAMKDVFTADPTFLVCINTILKLFESFSLGIFPKWRVHTAGEERIRLADIKRIPDPKKACPRELERAILIREFSNALNMVCSTLLV